MSTAIARSRVRRRTGSKSSRKCPTSTSTRCTFTTLRRRGHWRGIHQYDAQLEDFSRKNIDAEIAALKSFEKRIEAIQPDDAAADLFRAATGRWCWATFARSC